MEKNIRQDVLEEWGDVPWGLHEASHTIIHSPLGAERVSGGQGAHVMRDSVCDHLQEGNRASEALKNLERMDPLAHLVVTHTFLQAMPLSCAVALVLARFGITKTTTQLQQIQQKGIEYMFEAINS